MNPLSVEGQFRRLIESVCDYAIILLDADGIIRSWNPGAEQLKGYAAEEAIGRHFSIFYPEEALRRRWPEHELEVAAATGRFEDEAWRLRKDGSRFWANVIVTALHDEHGHVIGYGKITRDLTRRREQEEELRQSEERFRLLVDSVQDYAIFMLDANGCVASWNPGAARLKGYSAADIIGRHFSVFYPPEVAASGWPAHELTEARRTGRFEDEGWRVRKDGTRFMANVVINAVHDGTGQLRGFAKVTRDVTERQRVQILEHEGRQMTEFLAMLGHELRNPLASIRNAAGILRARDLADPGVVWARDLIDRQVSHLGVLVDDLLDVGRITSGKVVLHHEPADLALIACRAVESTRPLSDARHQFIDIAVPTQAVVVNGDPTRLSQVALNILNNAVKYTPPRGHIEVRVEAQGQDAVLRVRDDGIGMSSELLPRVFDLFAQGERSLDRSEGGLGVGLTLVRQLVEMHGGTVTANSAGAGRGSEFVVRLPLLCVDPADLAATGPSEPAAAGTSKRRRVLVVDDNPDSADSMSMLLTLWGHETRVAGDGPSAMALVAEFRPDLVLLDIGLPGMSGYEVAAQLHAQAACPMLVAMTGYGQEEDRAMSSAAGFSMHLVKPVSGDDLRELLARLGEKSSASQ
jgi:PAS domain S-box-containing protein